MPTTFPISALVLQGDADAAGFTINNLDLTGLSLTKASVGLGNVDNTSDVNKPLSNATVTALALKQNFIVAGTTAQFWRGDKTWVAYGALALQNGATTLPSLTSIGANATSISGIAALRSDDATRIAIEQFGASYPGSVYPGYLYANAAILDFYNASRAVIKVRGNTPLIIGVNGNKIAQFQLGLNVGGNGDPGLGCIAAADTISAQTFLGSSINISGPPGNGSLLATRGTIVYLVVGNGAAVDSTPLKFVSGPLLATPQSGGIEFEDDLFYGTVTTAGERKTFAFVEDLVGNVVDADLVHTSGDEDISGVKNFLSAPLVPAASFPTTAIDYTDTPITEAATITLPLGSISSSTVSSVNTLTTIAFAGGVPTSTQAAITLRLVVAGGPRTIAIPTSARLGETGSIASIVLQNGNHELSWVYAAGQYWLADSAGAGVTVLSYSANHTTTLIEANKTLLHPSSDNNARTFTIDSNANVAYAVGTEIEFLNQSATALAIAITTDTMTLIGSGATGTRSLANNGRAIAQKITTTSWVISGTNVT